MKDVTCRISVGVVSMPATRTHKGRLAFAALSVDCPAGRAGLRSISGVNLYKARCLVEKLSFDLVPSHIKDGTIEAGLLLNITTWELKRSLCCSCHVLRTQTLYDHGSKAARNIGCGAMRPMLTNACLLCAQPGNATKGNRVTLRTAFSAGGNALRPTGLAVKRVKLRREYITATIREHQRHRDAAIDTDNTTRISDIPVDQTANGDLPTERRLNNSCLADVSFNWVCEAQFDPTDLRKPNARPFTIDCFNMHFAAYKAKGFMDAFALVLREATKSLPCAAVRFIKRFQGALLACLGYPTFRVGTSVERTCSQIDLKG